MAGTAVTSRTSWSLERAALLVGTWNARRKGDPVARLLAPSSLALDCYDLYEQVRSRGRVVPSVFGTFATAAHDLCDEALRHPDLGSSAARRPDGPAHPLAPPSMIAVNPPEHSRHRRLVQQGFSARTVERLRPVVERMSSELLEGWSGEVDLVPLYAGVLPVAVIAELLGVAQRDRDDFRRWGNAVAQTLDTSLGLEETRAADRGLEALNDYFAAEIAQRRAEPADDVLSELVRSGPDGDGLTDREVLATALLLLVAGFETTVNLLGNAVQLLASDRDLWRSLATDDTLRKGAVEEVLRLDPPVQYTTREVLRPCELGGQRLDVGQTVLVLLAGAGRDPDRFPDPTSFDPTRVNAREHLAFASGVHYCLGAGLARLEADVALRHLSERYPDLRVARPGTRRNSRLLRGFDALPLSLNR